MPAHRLAELQTHYLWTLVSFALGTLLVMTAVAYVVVLRVSKPIEIMSAAAGRAAAGDLDIDVPYDAGDEVGRLAASVNRMKRSLTDKIGELENERHLLLSVLGG